MQIIAVPRVLREKLGEDGVDSLIELLNRVSAREDVLTFVEEKFERRLSEEMAKINQRITNEVAKINQRISEEIHQVRAEIHRMRADIIKWMFIFWVGQIGVIVGLLIAFLK